MQLRADTHAIARSGEQLGELAAALGPVTRGAEAAVEALASAVGSARLASSLHELLRVLRATHHRVGRSLDGLGHRTVVAGHVLDVTDRRLADDTRIGLR